MITARSPSLLPPPRYPVVGTMGQRVVREPDLMPALFVPMNRSIGGLTADVTIEEQERDELTITEHPVEQGAPIADHAFKRPSEVTIRAAWSATKHNLNSVYGTYNTLLSWQSALNPFQLYTGKRVYNDMLISSIAVTTDQSTEYVLMATIICRQIIRVRTHVVETAGVTNTENTSGDTPQTESPAQTGTRSTTQHSTSSGTGAVVARQANSYRETGSATIPSNVA